MKKTNQAFIKYSPVKSDGYLKKLFTLTSTEDAA